MKALFYIQLIFTIIILSGCEKGGNIDVEAEILKEMSTAQIPSVVACVISNNEIVWEGIFGFADISESRLTTRQTSYTLMSISKLFLATAVMQLWERGRINLDEDINQYLPFEVKNPKFPNQKITARMLLIHTSSLAWPTDEDGIPGFYLLFQHDEVPLISEWLPEYILPGGSFYRASVWKDFPPGQQELYSNIGTSLLALIVENIWGIDYRDYCKSNIFEPLEMHNTDFRLSGFSEELLAIPYIDINHPLPQFTNLAYPAASIKSSMEDFSHFMIAILSSGAYKGIRILEPGSVEKMFELHNPATGRSLIWTNCLGDCIGHSGTGDGFSTRAEWYPESGKGLLIFSNKRNELVYPKGRIYELVRYQFSKY
jgi:CubicO group peptidase (beta-lactamase class C family)